MNIFMSPIVIGVAILAVAALVTFIAVRLRRDPGERAADLGEVSSHWVMEHRAGSGHDSSRWGQR